jgi:hypothetical protein
VSEIRMISVEGYLYQLGLACLEGATAPETRPLLLAVLQIAPRIIAELQREARRARMAA